MAIERTERQSALGAPPAVAVVDRPSPVGWPTGLTVGLLGAVALAYIVAALWINRGTIFTRSYVDYFTLLMDGVTQGRLWIESPRVDDLAEFEGRLYLYWGPSPLLLIAPLYFLAGFQHDVAYTLVLGVASVMVCAWMIREAARALEIPFDAWAFAMATLLFAFASPNFYMSLQGRIWHTSQIGAALYCLLSLTFTFRFINRRRLVDIVLSSIFFCLAWDARLTLVATGPVLLYGVVRIWQRDPKLGLRALALVTIVGLAAVSSWGLYNYARFGSVTETGYTYTHHAPRYLEGVRTGTLWSWQYLGHNWQHYILASPVDLTMRRFVFDEEGNSILWMYPWTLLVLVLPFVWRAVPREARPLLWVLAGVALLQFTAELTFYSTGYTQVGARYFLDSVPVLFVLLLPAFQKTPRLVLASGLLVGLLLNVIGTSRFYHVPLG